MIKTFHNLMTSAGVRVERALVIAHDPGLRFQLVESLSRLGLLVEANGGSGEMVASTLAVGTDAVFVSAMMPNRFAFLMIKRAASVCPPPLVIVVSTLPHPDLFDLAQAGARAHLSWPATEDEIRSCLRALHEPKPDLGWIAAQLVGRIDLRDAQTLLRRAMLRRAMSLSDGSLSAAARILGVTRPAVQRIVRDDRECSSSTVCAPLPSGIADH